MRKIVLLSLTSLFIVALAGSAWACHFSYVTPSADCDGWQVDGHIYFSGTAYADLVWVVRLNQGSTVVAEFTGSERIYQESPYFSYSAPWGMELCGDYTVTGNFHFTSPSTSDSKNIFVAFNCPCEPPDGCTGTPGYWRNHADEWPVSSLTVGCVNYPKADLLDIFDWSARGDATVKLFHHTVAAKLNVLHGADNSIQPSIDAADAFLCDHPLLSRPTGGLKTEANAIKDALVAYNESNPCGESVMPVLVAPSMTAAPKAPPQPKESTWGAIKALYE
jgi:hypothetical protein